MSGGKRHIQELVERMRAIEKRGRVAQGDLIRKRTLSTAVGMLRTGRLHEWIGVETNSGVRWTPPIAVLINASRCMHLASNRGLVAWIGRQVWPYPTNLGMTVLGDSIFVDPPNAAMRLWTIDVALRSRAVVAVAADGSGLNIQATRRLQLAAESSDALVMLARPHDEESIRSAAAFRWRVRTAESVNSRPRWEVTMIRGKDAAGMTLFRRKRSTQVEWRHGEGLVAVPAVVADRAADAARRSA